MRFEKMTDQEFQVWLPRSKASYAKDKMQANSLTEQEASEMAEKDFLRLLPDGPNSENNFLFTMKDDANPSIGYLWLNIRGAADNRKAFIYDIIIEEEHRGKGLGRKAMLLADDEARKLGS